jgi:lipoate-protein ligase B
MVLDLGVIDYDDALKLQRELVNKRRSGQINDSLLIVEHPPVFTIGRSGSRNNLLAKEEYLSSRSIKVINVDRGGDITFHSPGQLVIYPIIDLKERTRDLHRYLRDLEEVGIKFLQRYSVSSNRVAGSTGVWVLDKKIASIGIAAKDWVTYHGMSLNVNNKLKFFSMINPCGIKGLQMTSLQEALGQEIPMNLAKKALLNEFNRVFGIEETRSAYELCPILA